MPAKQSKKSTDTRLTPAHMAALVAIRDGSIRRMRTDHNLTVTELAFVFNLQVRNISKITRKFYDKEE